MKRFEMSCNPVPEKQAIVGKGYRLSVLSPMILRVELSRKNVFEDRPSQMAVKRDFDTPDFTPTDAPSTVTIETASNVFVFNKKSKKVKVFAKDSNGEMRKLSASKNLGGTCRTLDFKLGAVSLGKGLMSKGGMTIVDDSKTYLINNDGLMSARKKGAKDFYVFAFDNRYAEGLVDFFKLTGFPPVLPKYALGNWWSRYYPYSQSEYIDLMDEFARREIPLTVATIDMDWHWVKGISAEYGTGLQGPGWTGYSWNTELFPDYKKFLKDLRARGLATTLNVHPALGVRPHEDMYEEMAKAMDVDSSTKPLIKFDLTNPKFLDAYFKVLHHPYEKDGVDFWWIDWQQGKRSAAKGLDPLWLLNHYHLLDINRDKKQNNGIILSRYAKLGSHRYPLGFSGDMTTAWCSLRFQPYMTATASNVGYTWWSHDIGGHQFGTGDDEIYLRWLQFGVFSPINRLHSSRGTFYGKEPWLHRRDVMEYATEIMQFRHKMLPYLYTANVLTAKQGEPLISPMYYNITSDDNAELAYKSKASYFFGNQLVVAPITKKLRKNYSRAGIKFYLPAGEWTDIFTGQKYKGGKVVKLYRTFESIPVLAKSGAILPLLADEKSNSMSFENLEVWAYQGNGNYTMFDDNGASITFAIETTDKGSEFKVFAPNGKLATKTIKVVFKDIESAEITVNGVKQPKGNSVTVEVGEELSIKLTKIQMPERPNFIVEVEKIMQDYHIFILYRILLFLMIKKSKSREDAYKYVKRMCLRKDVKGALLEVLGLEI